jgi:hypothetical protein
MGPVVATEETELGVENSPGLRIERLLWRPAEPEGGILEIRFRLVGVDELPRHPSVTYIVDPETNQKIQLRQPTMLPPSADDPEQAPLATLSLHDESGLILPGRRVMVVVAGLVQSNVLVETTEEFPAEVPTPRHDTVPEDAKLEVIKLRASGGGYLLDLRYRIDGAGMVLADEHTTYIEHAETGEKLYVLGVARIGTLATKDAGPSKTSYLLIQNPERKIKPGDRVHVVVAGIRAENALVE